jgi:DegV family protein with EDD domain
LSAAERINAHGKIHVINSLNASLGQGLLAVFAAECAHAGASIDATIAAVNELIPRTLTYGMLSDLRYAVKGGRVPAWVGTVANALNVTPFIRATPEGRIAPCGFAFGQRNKVGKFARSLARQARGLGPLNVAIGHSAYPEGAGELEQLLRRDLPQIERLTTAHLGSALGVHTGPGALIVSLQPATKPPQ